jgi:thiol-disulfide isomerase/thioredoxin
MKKLILILIFITINLYASYEDGKKLYEKQCSSCHKDYISIPLLKENFFNKQNKLLNLKSPTTNMIVYAMFDSPKHIGDKEDPEMQKIEIEEYLKDYIHNPDIENSICDDTILKFYDIKNPVKTPLSEQEILDLVDYFYDYKKVRKKNNPTKKKILKDTNDANLLIEEAKKENKLILIEATSKNCHYCRKMNREVLNLDDVKKEISKNYIFAKVNVSEYKLPFDLHKHYKNFTPTFFIIDSNKKLLQIYPGSWSKSDFLQILKENIK